MVIVVVVVVFFHFFLSFLMFADHGVHIGRVDSRIRIYTYSSFNRLKNAVGYLRE